MCPVLMETGTGSPVSRRLHHGPRRNNNKEAARRSRKKHTERADELHQELQTLEQSNGSIQKEIAELKKEVEKYEKMLKDHEPKCLLRVRGPPAAPPFFSTHPNSLFSGEPPLGPPSAQLTSEFNIHHLINTCVLGGTGAPLVCPPPSRPPVSCPSPTPQRLSLYSPTSCQPSVAPPTAPQLNLRQEVPNHPDLLFPLLFDANFTPTPPSNQPPSPLSLLLQDDVYSHGSLPLQPLDIDDINVWIKSDSDQLTDEP